MQKLKYASTQVYRNTKMQVCMFICRHLSITITITIYFIHENYLSLPTIMIIGYKTKQLFDEIL